MSLTEGTRVGPYEITGQLGAGGMGEVCRARDTKLNRDVALKVLPEAFVTDPERMSRFQREAQLLAALNHPNIAAIYGLEDGGSRQAIVMELVEGATLARPVPIVDALRIAKQIADAIEYAHDRGIIHRDLKPDNIKVTPDGSVKVLDFGLAKAMDEAVEPTTNFFASMSPTLSLAATQAGVILGTAAYMAPEQAKGRPADRRSDVWAFGVVLYEMLTGDRMFGGDSVPETLASVMKDPITFGKLPDQTPAPIRRLVSRCLEREPRRRLQSIGEARIVLEDVIAGVSDESVAPPVSAPKSGSKWPWAVAAIALLTAVGVIAWTQSRPSPAAPAVTRFTVPPADGTIITAGTPNAPNVALSPDGRYVAYVADQAGRDRTIWIRALDSLIAQRLDKTEGAQFPFWSPNSQHIAYFADGKLMRIPIAGGAPQTICVATTGEGGAWFQGDGEDVIVFAPEVTGGLSRVLAQGGLPTPVTKLAKGEVAHSFPQFLPDGKRILYLVEGDKTGIYVQTLGADERTFVVETIGRAAYSPPGLLLYLRENTLLAHRWNLDTLRLEGEPVSLADDVRSGGANGRNAFTVSANGVLAYRGGGSLGNFQIVSYTRDGKSGDVLVPHGELGPIELSPDDTRMVVVSGLGTERDLWLKDLVSGVYSRLTSTAGQEVDPFWSPDSRRVGYSHVHDGKRALYETLIGSGKHVAIPLNETRPTFPEGWTPDGKQIVIRSGNAVHLVPAPQEGASAAEERKAQTVFDETYVVDQIRVSRDGKWVAYMSQESGRPEINVASFPSFTNRRQISSGGVGATQPLWRADGRELFFLARDLYLMAVEVTPGATLETGPVRRLFQTTLNTTSQAHLYAVTRDGKKFLLRESARGENNTVEPLYIVTNWTTLVR